MSGLRIMFRLVDIGWNEPTRIYDMLQEPDGKLKMSYKAEMHMASIDEVGKYLLDQEIRRPVVLVDPHPMVTERLKSIGIRVR